MRSRRNRWLSGIGAAVLIGGLVLASGGSWVTPASAHNSPPPPNPFAQILTKLDEILAAIASIGSSGGDGNHTLRWDTVLPAATRFVVLTDFASAAVLDKETGLVWEKSPAIVAKGWGGADYECANKNIGGRYGWRLPSLPELTSLIDPSLPASADPKLPPGHPFTNVLADVYWTATMQQRTPPTVAWGVNIASAVSPVTSSDLSTLLFHEWCVRGGMNADAY